MNADQRNFLSWEIQIRALFHIWQNLSINIIPSISRWFVGSSRISKSTSCKRNFAIWTLVCSPQESFKIGKCNCSEVNQKYFKISICKSYFWYASFAIIHSMSSPCSWIKAIGSHSPVSSKYLISSSLSTVFVTSGNVVFISSITSLSLFSQRRSWERNQIFVSFNISISPWSANSGLSKILRNVDFPAPFLPTRAILSSGLILRSAPSKRIVDQSCLLSPFMVIR